MRRINDLLMEKLAVPAPDNREGKTQDDMLVFVIKGNARLMFENGNDSCNVKKGDVFTLSKGTLYHLDVLEYAIFLSLHIRMGKNIPEHFFSISENQIVKKTKHSCFSKLKMNSHLWNLADTILSVLNNFSAQSYEYFTVKLFEFCNIIKAGYNMQEATNFFFPVITEDKTFTDFVMKNYLEVTTVKELVKLSPYSLSVFKRRFWNSFGDTPYQWMKRQKAKRMFYLIKYSKLTFSEISYRMGFSSLSQFTAFCKTNLGNSPSIIRKKRKI